MFFFLTHSALKIGVLGHKLAKKHFQSSQTARFTDMYMNFLFPSIDINATSFLASPIFPRHGGKMRDPGNEVDVSDYSKQVIL